MKRTKTAAVQIAGNDPDYRELFPIHSQLLGGGAAPSKTNWADPFHHWVAQNDLEDYKSSQFWTRLGLETLAAAAFVVAEIATAGSATFFIAAGVGLGVTGGMAIDSFDKYEKLANAAKTNVKDATAVVDQATVDKAEQQAIADAVAFVTAALAIGVKGLGGIGKRPGAPQVSIPEGKFGYLLNNPSKAGVFSKSMGFTRETLEPALRKHLAENLGKATPPLPMVGGGTKFSVTGPLVGPSGQKWTITSVWGVDPDGAIRLITATP